MHNNHNTKSINANDKMMWRLTQARRRRAVSGEVKVTGLNKRNSGNTTGCAIFLIALLASLLPLQSFADVEISSPTFTLSIDSRSMDVTKNLADGIFIHKAIKPHENITRLILNLGSQLDETQFPIRLSIGKNFSNQPDERAGLGASFYDDLDAFVGASDLEELKTVEPDGSRSLSSEQWFGWSRRYHIEAIRFDAEKWDARIIVGETAEQLTPQDVSVELRLKSESTDGPVILQLELLTVPKLRQVLADPEIALQDVLFMNLWGWFRELCLVVWIFTDFLYAITGSWGVSIVMLALAVRVVSFPITRFSIKHQEVAIQQQARVAPLLKDIKNNYTGITQSEKIIELYETQNYDHLAPFKSMLGLFIQIPIFAALFSVLGEMWVLSGQSFLWIADLSKSDRIFDWGINLPYFGAYLNLLPILMGGVTILSTWLAARHAGNENSPTTTLFGMGVVFFVLFYSFPSALVLYWLSSNVFQLIQQTVDNQIKSYGIN